MKLWEGKVYYGLEVTGRRGLTRLVGEIDRYKKTGMSVKSVRGVDMKCVCIDTVCVCVDCFDCIQ